MDWEVAAQKSSRGVAERFTDYGDREYVVCRWLDGHTRAYTTRGRTTTLFYVPESWSEGYDDWFPAKG